MAFDAAPLACSMGTSIEPNWDRPEERTSPHYVRSQKHGGQLMRQDQFLALERIPVEIASFGQLQEHCSAQIGFAIANRIRVRCSIHSVATIPPDLAVETLVLVREIRAKAAQHVARGGKLDRQYITTQIGGDAPWTAWIKRRIGRPLDERPDWRALCAEILARKPGKESQPPKAEKPQTVSIPSSAAPAPASGRNPISEAQAVLKLVLDHLAGGGMDRDRVTTGINIALQSIARSEKWSKR